MDYIIFGIVDNGVMILGAFTGIEVEKYLPDRFKMGALMPIVGAVAGRMDELSEKKKATQAFQDISGQDKTAEINAIAMAQLEGTGLLNA